MKHIGLFEGIGGFSLAARWAGWDTVATCEINPFCQTVISKNFPQAVQFGDIKELTYDAINTQLSTRFGTRWRNDDLIITGGFP